MKILQSTVERLAWYVVLLMLIGQVVVIYIQYNQGQQVKHNTIVIQDQMNCIATFFNQNNVQGGTPLKIKDLASCRLGK